MNDVKKKFDVQYFLKQVTQRPGIYKMLDANSKVIYVGKAKNLKNRLRSYFVGSLDSQKTQQLVAKIADIEVVVTHTETEALLLEAELIRRIKPHFNIALKDDKSFPYIRLRAHHEFPRLEYYRGRRNKRDKFFGPFPNSYAVRESLQLAQRIFRIRSCSDSFFAQRTRPCLQYQIERCSGPCVAKISPESYQRDVNNAQRMLSGETDDVVDSLVMLMDDASERQEYEYAAVVRDQIKALRVLQEKTMLSNRIDDNCDVVALARENAACAAFVLSIRGGRNTGQYGFQLTARLEDKDQDLMAQFLSQFYIDRNPPREVLLSHTVENKPLLEAAIQSKVKHRVRLTVPKKGQRATWIELAKMNASNQLKMAEQQKLDLSSLFNQLAKETGAAEGLERVEGFDISHTQGNLTVASCVVFGTTGPLKDDYRRFNISGIEPGDDYAALAQAVLRRYTRLAKEGASFPGIILIDGGKEQLNAAANALASLDMSAVTLLGMSKGSDRRAGRENIWRLGSRVAIPMDSHSNSFKLLQQVRDEAHRFALSGHRRRRGKAATQSVLEGIEGLGATKRRELLRHFGGLQGIKRAGIQDLRAVKGVGPRLASSIYERFHSD